MELPMDTKKGKMNYYHAEARLGKDLNLAAAVASPRTLISGILELRPGTLQASCGEKLNSLTLPPCLVCLSQVIYTRRIWIQ